MDTPAETGADYEELKRKRELLQQLKKEKEEQLASLLKGESPSKPKSTKKPRSNRSNESESENPKRPRSKKNGEGLEKPRKHASKSTEEPSTRKRKAAEALEKEAPPKKPKTEPPKPMAMGLDQYRQFHELRQEHKRNRKLIEEHEKRLSDLTRNFAERINTLQNTVAAMLTHLGLQSTPTENLLVNEPKEHPIIETVN